MTYNGHPLYLFQNDQNAGDANGQGVNAFGAAWYVMSPAGDAITTSGSGSNAGGGSSSGYSALPSTTCTRGRTHTPLIRPCE